MSEINKNDMLLCVKTTKYKSFPFLVEKGYIYRCADIVEGRVLITLVGKKTSFPKSVFKKLDTSKF